MLSGRGKCEKLTKINILHVTINYIRAMENLLTTGDSGVHSYSEMVRNPIRPDENAKGPFTYDVPQKFWYFTQGAVKARTRGLAGLPCRASKHRRK